MENENDQVNVKGLVMYAVLLFVIVMLANFAGIMLAQKVS
jgi:hypothetical protein